MKNKILLLTATIILLSLISAGRAAAPVRDTIERIKISDKDVPEGFTYGKIPGFAKSVLKENPWSLDRTAIKKMTGKIYPDGDQASIAEIHMTIMAKKSNPFRDDIVCYVIIYKNDTAAKKEMKKITSFAEYNRDRVILLTRNNVVVYFSVDSTDNFEYIRALSSSVKTRLEDI